MTDAWDNMIAGDDAEVSAEIMADSASYVRFLARGDSFACTAIEQKYGLYGLSPEQVTEQLAEMAKPDGALQ